MGVGAGLFGVELGLAGGSRGVRNNLGRGSVCDD